MSDLRSEIHEPELCQEAPAHAGVWPEAFGSRFAARVSNRLAIHVPLSYARLNNSRPIVSFTFDDVPHSAATVGAEILGEHGGHGTFYVAGGLVGTDGPLWRHATASELTALHHGGHELGCHTFSHQKLYQLGGARLIAEADRNEAFFKTLDPSIDLQNFAYPWGVGDFRRKWALSRRYRSSRSVRPGINKGRVDPQFLLSMALEATHIDAAGVDRVLDEACRVNGWLIFYGHEVATRSGAFVCSPALFSHAVAGARRRDMQIASVAEAIALAGI
jgi:peptidoglycan/xylan/chitin deacetylase (PgdA/CDA1 family)